MNYLTTKETAKKLGVSVGRIQQLVAEKRLPSVKIGRDRLILESDLGLVAERKTGRPPKTENGASENDNKKPKSFAEVAAKFIGSIKDGLPTDLSANKEYLKDLGKKSAEKRALQRRKQLLKDE